MVFQACGDVQVSEILLLFGRVVESFQVTEHRSVDMNAVSNWWCIGGFRPHWDSRAMLLAMRRLAILYHRFCHEYTSYVPDKTCLWVLLDKRSSKASYFIDLFCQLVWLLDNPRFDQPSGLRTSFSLSAVRDLVIAIRPAVNTCRYMYATCAFGATARSKYLTRPSSWDGTQHSSFVGCDVAAQCLDRQVTLQDFLERGEKQPSIFDFLERFEKQPGIFYTLQKAMDVLDLMLEIASIMRSLEEQNISYGHLSPRTLILNVGKCWRSGTCMKLVREPSQEALLPNAGYCYIAPEISITGASVFNRKASENFWSDVYSYGCVCFNILTGGVGGALNSVQSIGSRSDFYDFVRSGRWKQLLKDDSEYLVSLIAWCWDTDPHKRPTFATICSLLHRAMRCLISPPDVMLHLPLEISKYDVLEFYLSFTWRCKEHFNVIGTKIMNELLELLATDIIELQHFSSDFLSSKSAQRSRFSDAFMVDYSTHVKKTDDKTETRVIGYVLSWGDLSEHPFARPSHADGQRPPKKHQQALKSTLSKFSEVFRATSLQQFAASNNKLLINQGCHKVEEEQSRNRNSSPTGFVRELQCASLIELGENVDDFSDIAFKVGMLEEHSCRVEALVFDSMRGSFPFLNSLFWINPLVNMSHDYQRLDIPRPKSLPLADFEFEMNLSLLPRLACFWEGHLLMHERCMTMRGMGAVPVMEDDV